VKATCGMMIRSYSNKSKHHPNDVIIYGFFELDFTTKILIHKLSMPHVISYTFAYIGSYVASSNQLRVT